jgi:hypothetical protein
MSETTVDSSIMIKSAWVALPKATRINFESQITINDLIYPHPTEIKEVIRESDHKIDYIKVILGNPVNGGEL